ncbi:MAG: hypothetical protein OXN84_07285 [Albidovulum sp.]|nr:hypothetical protein [Albidovulum sp.]
MLVPSGLPGVRGLASEVLAELREGSLVAVSVPTGNTGRRWLGWFREALRDRARESGEPLPIDLPPFSASLADPFSEIAAADGVGRVSNLEDLLEHYPDDGALVLVVECEAGLGADWKAFFDSVRRAFRSAGHRRLRPVLALIVGSDEYPPIKNDVGSRVFALWNMLRWEEVRLLALDVLPHDENALVRAWRTATYAGAANGDPELLLRLCRECPNRLDQVIESALPDAKGIGGLDLDVDSIPDQRWNVPLGCVGPWSAGELIGYTIDRGTLRAVAGMAQETADRYVRAAIWREQLSGLFPIVVELGFGVAPAITSVMGRDWLREVPADRIISDGDVRLEPKAVMDIFVTGRYRRLPASIWSFLVLLRKTRNDLAHMSPIELQRMRQIWQGHNVIGRRFGSADPR